ncbi:MAG: hypothetical protein WCO51_01430 [bacterium]
MKTVLLHNVRNRAILLVVVAAVLSSIGMAAKDNNHDRNDRYNQNDSKIVIRDGTVIPVSLDQDLNSRNNRKGDRFTVTIYNDSNYLNQLPRGTQIEGVIVDRQKANKNHPGMLKLRFERIVLPDGQSENIDATLVNLKNKTTNSGRIIADRNKKDVTGAVAFGAVSGLIIGSANHKPVQGLILGAIAGALLGGATQGNTHDYRDIVLKDGTKFGVRIDQRLVFNNYRDNSRYDQNRDRNDDTNYDRRDRNQSRDNNENYDNNND